MFSTLFKRSQPEPVYDSGNPALPDELLFKILSYLDSPQDLANVLLSSRLLSRIAHDDRLWEAMANRFAHACPNILELERSTLFGKTGLIEFMHRYFTLQQQELSLLCHNKLLSQEQIQIIREQSQVKFTYFQLCRNELILNDINQALVKSAIIKQPIPSRLDLSGMGLTRLPSEFVTQLLNWNHIEALDLSDNHLYYLPHNFSALFYLRYLSFLNNRFTSIPRELLGWSYEPDFRGNRIAYLPGNTAIVTRPEELMATQKSMTGMAFGFDKALNIIHAALPTKLQNALPWVCIWDVASKAMKSQVPLFTIGVAAAKAITGNERRKWEASKTEKDILSPKKHQVYLTGREARRWKPYVKSMFDLSLYRTKERRLFLAGLNDAQSNQPVRKIVIKIKPS